MGSSTECSRRVERELSRVPEDPEKAAPRSETLGSIAGRPDVLRLQSLRALFDFELDLGAF